MNKKPFKVLSATALAAAFTASSIVPVASVSAADEQVDIAEVIFENHEGKLVKLGLADYSNAEAEGIINFKLNQYIKGSDNKYYSVQDYAAAYAESDGTVAGTFALLTGMDKKPTDKVYEAKYNPETNQFDAVDEQPEDRLNETFFYNAA